MWTKKHMAFGKWHEQQLGWNTHIWNSVQFVAMTFKRVLTWTHKSVADFGLDQILCHVIGFQEWREKLNLENYMGLLAA